MLVDFTAGYISGVAGIVVGNPLDVIKVRTQANTKFSTITALPWTATRRGPWCTNTPNTISAETLLRGVAAPILTYGALNAVLFASYSHVLSLFPHHKPVVGHDNVLLAQTESCHSYLSRFSAGSIAGIATFFISTPTELVKCRTQVWQQESLSGTPVSSWSVVRSVWLHQGIRGLFSGGVITSVRDAVGYGFYFLAYEASKDFWKVTVPRLGQSCQREDHPPVLPTTADEAASTLLCGGLAGVVSWAVIFPLDVVKTRVQTQNSANLPSLQHSSRYALHQGLSHPLASPYRPGAISGDGEPAKAKSRRSAWAVARLAYRTEGAGVFLRGLSICCVRAFIVNAIQWSVYEAVVAYLKA